MISGTPQARRSSNPFRPHRNRAFASMPLGGLLALLVWSGCDAPPPNATGANPPPASANKSLVRLTADEKKAAGIVVQPVTRAEFRTIRDFPGTVEPNEHALAEITTLVRGRVIDVYADLGREVKGGTLLARPMKGTAPRGSTPEQDAQQASARSVQHLDAILTARRDAEAAILRG
mgnify:CR=1 FL=1